MRFLRNKEVRNEGLLLVLITVIATIGVYRCFAGCSGPRTGDRMLQVRE